MQTGLYSQMYNLKDKLSVMAEKVNNTTTMVTGIPETTTTYDFGCGSHCPEPMSIQMKVLITVAYSAITLIAIGGNVSVCYIVFAYQRMRTVTNYFIVNLAFSDILMAVMCIPFTFIANLLMGFWPFGMVMCPLVSYLQTVSVFLSAFTLVAISLDRFVAILLPLRPKLSTRQAVPLILLIWTLSLLVSLPVAMLSRVEEKRDVLSGDYKPFCEEHWSNPKMRYVYSTLIMVLQYFLPLFVLAITYTWIGYVIWVRKPPGEAQTSRDQRRAASKRKLVKMVITVVIIYGVCWLPIHSIQLIGEAHPSIWTFKYIQTVWIACHWLAMSNCCYNPMVYCWMNMRFRSGFKHVFRFCPCVVEESPANVAALKVKWNYTCVYSMNAHERSLYQRRMHRNCMRCDDASSSSTCEYQRHQNNKPPTFSLKRFKNGCNNNCQNCQMFS